MNRCSAPPEISHRPWEARQREKGSTLIELLIAMVLLAVALLATALLAAASIRAVAQAERDSRATAMAAHYLEGALLELRQNQLPGQLSCTLASGDQLNRTVDLTNPHLPIVSVTVTPEPRSSAPRPLTLTSASFAPSAFTGMPPDATCPP